MGAAEFIFKNNYNEINRKISKYIDNYRVITLAYSKHPFFDSQLPSNLQLMAIILIKDKIRNNAEKILNFFKKQGD